ncbi:DMT family transporter [Acidisoma silvae]|uniref:DMT family transporter n=1 Tax=Acidisoma silvae TaxID=2802396 RepID=A0A963YUL9_9PROT|nr:DMT family transporter [Acidisoma silvae]
MIFCAAGAALTGTSFGAIAGKIGGLPWWAVVGGLCQLIFTITAASVTQKIGSAGFTVTVLVVAVILSLFLDAFGVMGLPVRDLTWPRLVGAALAVCGVTLVSIF